MSNLCISWKNEENEFYELVFMEILLLRYFQKLDNPIYKIFLEDVLLEKKFRDLKEHDFSTGWNITSEISGMKSYEWSITRKKSLSFFEDT